MRFLLSNSCGFYSGCGFTNITRYFFIPPMCTIWYHRVPFVTNIPPVTFNNYLIFTKTKCKSTLLHIIIPGTFIWYSVVPDCDERMRWLIPRSRPALKSGVGQTYKTVWSRFCRTGVQRCCTLVWNMAPELDELPACKPVKNKWKNTFVENQADLMNSLDISNHILNYPN